MGGAWSVLARKSTPEDEQASEAGGKSKRRRELVAPDCTEDTFGRDGKRVRSCDNGGASSAIVPYSGVQLHCSDEEAQSLLFSSKPRTAASGNVLDPSGSGENVQKLRSFEVDPARHKIFLSHCGEQKNFVEQLCVDLEARGYLFPFFDQRHHSLPKGKDFAPLIKQAARLCHVAVIVLSEKFLCSKWPMIELVEFHAAKQGGNRQMSMLPLFFKLKVGDLDDESIEGRWMPVWKELARKDNRIDVSMWAAAVKALRGVNGLQFDQNTKSEVGYRKEIVGSIWKMLPGDLQYDSARDMVGFNRICEIVSKKFVKDNVVGASVLGLYGTSGLGKTTLAKAACDYFGGEFEGRVCHVELGKNTKRMKQHKLMLKTFCGVEEDVLSRLRDDRQGLKVMRDCMKRDPVLLVIDNLTNDESSRREAHEYMMVGFHPSSKVMITARSKEVLQDLLPGVEFCMRIPKLNEEEAGMIFLRSAAPMKCFSSVTDEERKVLRLCVDKCLLEPDDSRDLVRDENPDNSLPTGPLGAAYHPLALSALGDYFYRLSSNTAMLHWKDSLEENNDLMRDVLQSSSIMSIIRLQFSTLSSGEQLLFLDLAFYLQVDAGGLFLVHYGFNDWVERLAIMHGERASVVERRLRDLKRSGMIDWDVRDDECTSNVPMLYCEFAEWYATEHGVAGLKNARCVFQPCDTSPKSDYRGSKCISDLVRLRVLDSPRASIWSLASKRMRELQNLVLLQIYECTILQALSLAGLHSLVHLELNTLPNLVTVTLTESSGTPEDEGIFKSLLYVRLEALDSLTHVPDLRSCTSVLKLEFAMCEKVTDFEGVECPHVRVLKLAGIMHPLERRPNFRSLQCLTSLFIGIEGHVDVLNAMDFASPSKLKRSCRGQSVALQDRADSDEFSADSDAYVFMDDVDTERTIIYRRREKQYVKEGLSIVQDVLSYLCRQGWHQNPVESCPDPNLSWSFDEGDKEMLYVFPCNGRATEIEWRCRSPEEYND